MVESLFKGNKIRKILMLFTVMAMTGLIHLSFSTEISIAQTASCTVTLNSGESIADALTAASAGDTICLNAGTYDGGFTIDKDDITLIGIDSTEKSIITGGGSYLVRIQNSLNTRIENLEFQSNVNFAIYGIGISSAPVEGVVLHNNIITGNNSGQAVLMSNYTANWTFSENEFENHSTGIRFQGADNVVSDNVFTNNILDIEISSGSNSTITNNLFSNGISFSSSDFNHTITGNTFPNGDVLYFSTSEDNPAIPSNARQIIVTNATNLEITGFTLSDSAVPIQVSHSSGAQIHNNVISNLEDNSLNTISSGAIKVSSSPNAVVYENMLLNNDMTAIYVTASNGAEIRDNELQSNLEGIKVRSSLNIVVDSNIITDTYNTSSNGGHGVYVVSSENIEILNNTITGSEGHGVYDASLTSNENALIQGNTITNGNDTAIEWLDSRYAVIEANTITNNADGIRGPFDGTIRNNTIENSGLGINARNNSLVEGNEIRDGSTGISASFNVEVLDNIITGHESTGVNLGSSNGQTISNNQMSGNPVDITFFGNENVTVTNNDLQTGIILYSSSGTFEEYDHLITGNTLDGKPLVYLKNETNPAIPANAGQIIVLNSTDVIISDFTFTNVANPISVLHSPGTHVSNNTMEGAGQTINNNSALIVAVYSDSTMIENNTLLNGRRGIGLYRSEGTTVHNNMINRSDIDGVYYGIYSRLSPSVTISENEINANGGTRGIEINGPGHYSVLINNEISNSALDAVVVSNVDSVKVEGNTIVDGDARGLYLSRANDASIINNTITGHSSHGIDTNFGSNLSDRPYLEGNFIANNSGTGIRLLVNELEMQDNTIEGNNIGAEIHQYFVLEENSFRNNTLEGLKIPNAVPDSYITQNIIEGNGSGVAYSGTANVLIAGNNWWGASSGPSGGVSDPITGTVANGSGDSVSSNVNFDSWLTTEPTDPIGETIFEYASFSVASDSIITGNTAGTSVLVTNTGDSLNYYQVDLKLDGVVVQSQSELLGAGQSKSVEMNLQISEPGTYQLSVNDLDSEAVEVVPGWPQNNFGANKNSTAEFLIGPKTDQVREKWRSSVFSSVRGAPTIFDNIIYYGMDNGRVYASDLETGDVLWETFVDGSIRSSPAISDSLIVSGKFSGEVFALSRHSGNQIWSNTLGSNMYSSVSISGNTVYATVFNSENETFHALDLYSGSTKWIFDIGNSSSSTPSINEGVIYVGSNDGNLYALDATDENISPEERLLWSFNTSNSLGLSKPAVYNDDVFITSGEVLYSINKLTGDLNWSKTLSGNGAGNPVLSENVLYVGSSGGTFYAVDANNGDEIWTYEPTVSFGTVTFSNRDASVADGIVYVQSNGNVTSNRRFLAIDTQTGEELFSFESTPTPLAGPIVYEGVAYVGYVSSGLRAYRESVPEDFIADASQSQVTATPSHWADGSDEAEVEITVINEFGEPVEGLTTTDFEFLGSENMTVSSVDEQFSEGEYVAYISNTTVENVVLTVEVNGVALQDQPTIEFKSTESNWSFIGLNEGINIDVYGSVSFVDSQKGWMTTYVDDSSDPHYILHTQDGGETWEDQYMVDSGGLGKVFFINDQQGWAFGSSFDGGIAEGFIIHTEDGGENWEVQRSVENSFVSTLYFLDENTGWAFETGPHPEGFGNSRFVLKTENGGETWQSTELGNVFNPPSDAKFIDENTGWITNYFEPGVFKSTNGGEDWAASADTSQINGIDFIDENLGWVVGENGAIFHTKDGGSTWENQDSGTTRRLNSVTFTDENTGWAVGDRKTILTTNDGGQTWNEEYPGDLEDFTRLLDLDFIDSTTGWAVGSRGAILKYENDTPAEPDPIVDATSSSVTTTSPHIADGEDASLVTVTLLNTDGDTLSGLQSSDFSRSVSGSTVIGDLTETESSGIYTFTVQSSEADTVTVTITAQGIELDDKPTIIFEEPEDEPTDPVVLVDADSSSVTATSPHVADGNDEATVSITLRTSQGQQIGGYSSDKFEVTLNDENASAGSVTETGSSGEYNFTVTSSSPGEIQLTVVADGVTLTDQPSILFEPEAEPVPDPPNLTSISEEEGQININWNVDSEQYIGSYNVYRGGSVSQLSEYTSVESGTQTFTETDIPEGTTYYAVSAVNNDGVEGERSNILSYVNENVVAGANWQLSSIPLGSATIQSDMATIFGFSNSYITTETLEHSKGYWVKTKTFDTELIPAIGVGLDSTSINLQAGWNLIGSLSDTVAVASISDVDGVLTDAPVYLFSDNQYVETNQIVPNQGHWIFASDSGRVDLSIYAEGPPADEGNGAELTGTLGKSSSQEIAPKILFSSGDESSEIVISDVYLSENDRYQFLMPPLAPDPVLDVRTSDHTHLMNNEVTRLQLRSEKFPVHVEIEGLEENFEYAYRLTVEKEGVQRSIDLIPGQPNILTEEYGYISLEKIHVDELITEHKLMPNYPNPFNPTTTIHYQLREQSQVRIEVFDVIGRRVQMLTNEPQYSGEYRVNFDARNFASGVYIIRLIAGDYMEIQKMTLIK